MPLGTAAAMAEQRVLLTRNSKLCTAGASVQLEKRMAKQMAVVSSFLRVILGELKPWESSAVPCGHPSPL